MTYTQGPWNVKKERAPNGGAYYRIFDGDDSANKVVAQVIGDGRIEYHANARLIAAAPDLLEALEGCIKFLESVPQPAIRTHLDDLLDNGRVAIAKTKGA